MPRKITIHTAAYVNLTSLVPEKWAGRFYAELSADAPFSWGDNDYTLITRKRFLAHAKRVLAECDVPDANAFVAAVEALPSGTLINLEN